MSLIEQYNEGNAFGKENNLTLNVLGEGHIEYTMQLEDKHMALPNLIHGGALAGFMDALLSVAAFTMVEKNGQQVATAEFKINYLQPVRKPCLLKGVGKVIKKGKRLIFSEAEIFDDSGLKVATGSGTIIVV